MPRRLKKFITYSIIFHIVALAFLWYNPPGKDMINKSTKVTWIKLSKGDGGTSKTESLKNSKDLPMSTVQEQKQAQKELAKDKEGTDLKSHESTTKKTEKQIESLKKTAENAGINIDKSQKKKTQTPPKTNSQIKDALARIDQQLKQREVDMGVAQAKTSEEGQSPWGSSTGTDIDPTLISYYNQIKKKINSEWVLAKGDFSGTLIAKIIVLIDSNGNILRSQFKRNSGNGSFDASAMRAVQRSAPFPVPPDTIKQEALTEGFLIEFNPKSVRGQL